MEHFVRPDGMPPTNGYSHAVAFTDLGDLAEFRRVRDEFITAQTPPASSLVQVSGLVNPEFLVEVEALAVT